MAPERERPRARPLGVKACNGEPPGCLPCRAMPLASEAVVVGTKDRRSRRRHQAPREGQGGSWREELGTQGNSLGVGGGRQKSHFLSSWRPVWRERPGDPQAGGWLSSGWRGALAGSVRVLAPELGKRSLQVTEVESRERFK